MENITNGLWMSLGGIWHMANACGKKDNVTYVWMACDALRLGRAFFTTIWARSQKAAIADVLFCPDFQVKLWPASLGRVIR